MLRRLTLGLLAIALVALAVLARVPRTGVGEAEAAGPVASISFSIVSTPVACGYSATIIATARDSGGNVVDNGTVINFTATPNAAITPAVATNTGRALATLSTSAVTGNVTVTASSGTFSASVVVPVSCGFPCGLVSGCIGVCTVFSACGTTCGINLTTCAPACGSAAYPNCSVCLGAPCYAGACAPSYVCATGACGVYACAAGACGVYGCAAGACYIGGCGCATVLCAGVCSVALGCGAVVTQVYSAPVVVVAAPAVVPNVGPITFAPYPKSGTCGSTLNISISASAPDGTAIGFTTSLGKIEASVTTFAGQAVARLTIDPKVSGNATITATAPNGVKASETLPISC
jgi:hypothetical protein